MGGYTGFLPFTYIAQVDDRAHTSNNLIDHFFRGRFIFRDAGDDDASGQWAEGDIDHLCGDQTRFATDDDLLGTELGRYEKVKEAREQAGIDALRRQQARYDAEAAAPASSSAQADTVASNSE